MQNPIERSNKRINYIVLAFLVIGALFLLRLFQRQVISRDQTVAMAEKQYYTRIEQPAKRGQVFINDPGSQDLVDPARDGLFSVASDLELYDVSVVPRNLKDKKDTAQKLAQILGEDKNKLFEEINNDKLYIPPLKKKVDKQTADKVKDLNMTGVFIEGDYSRFYPEGDFLSQTLGFVDYDGNGRYGIEEYYDGVLKGEGGSLTGLKDNQGKVIKVEQSEPGKDGASIVLTIDRSIQYIAEKKLKEGVERYGADGGSIIIMNPKDGAILAMASTPSYDPNKFNEVKQEDQGIFLNPATSLNWEPGSIFKPIIVSAAVDQGKVEPDSIPEKPFNNFVTVDGYEIHNALDKPYGFESVTEILENSDNVGMVWVADQAGDEVLGNYIQKFGFGQKTGICVSSEAAGQVPNWKKWRDVNRATISFGQGISATPVQIVDAYATIAEKGKVVIPRIVDRVIEPNGTEKEIEPEKTDSQVISKETAQKVKDMLVSVVENGHGRNARVDGFKVGGKTGTAQIPNKDGPGYEESVSIGSFAGFAPVDDPRFVMLVKFDRPKSVQWAESSAAPIFGEIADWLLNSYYKVPKTEVSPTATTADR